MPKATQYLLTWHSEYKTYELRELPGGDLLAITFGEREWFAWLDTVPSFTFSGKLGQFTARKESRKWGDGYWYAYLRSGRKLRKKYVGKTGEVTLARLEQIAALLAGQQPVVDTAPSTAHKAGAAALQSLQETQDSQQSTLPVVTTHVTPPQKHAHRRSSRDDLPAGTTTLLFTDIESSTRLLQQLGKQYAEVLPACRHLLRSIFQQHRGHEVDTQGDAFFVVFARATDAVSAAVAAQHALFNHVWPEDVVVRVRMGLHTGEPQLLSEGYVGLDVHQAARIASVGHGGQVLLSQTTRELVEHVLPKGVSMRDLGEYHLKDLQHPTHLYQLVIEGLAADFPPLRAVGSNKKDDPLLSTRLHVPRPRAQLVPRAHLVERLQQGMQHALTLVSAPAGFGKTTLLAQWIAESGMPVAWLSLEPEDNDPIRFLTYLTAALQTRNPSLGVNILELLEASQATPLESALIVLTNDIINRHIADFVLVLDDYHIITNEAIHRAMIFLNEHLPPQMHLILATRADPPLPLARLRARGQLVELRAADLRMNSTEADTFLHTVIGLDLPSDAISDLESRTEGWIAGLQLAALSLQGRTDVSTFLAAFTGSHRFVLDYLSEEILSRQPAHVLSFLLQTSILERLSGPLCDAVTAQEGSQAMLEALEQANLFTNALDDERHWYRYHHLFAEVLRNRLQRAQPLLVPELHRRASLWYEQHAQPVGAVGHALAAEDVERAARLIEQCSMPIITQGQTRTVLEWLNALPNALVRMRPLLAVYHASALHLSDQVETAEARLHDAERALSSSEMPSEQARNIRGIAAIVDANIARYSGNLPRYVSLGQQAYELLPEGSMMMRATSSMQIAYTYLVDGDVASDVEQKVRFAVSAASTADYPLVHFRSLTMLARLQVLQGRLRDAALTYEDAGQGVPGTQVLQVLTASAVYCFGLADLLREWNRLDEAEHLLSQGMELIRGKKSSFADDILLGYLTQARLQCARGAYSDASATVDAFIHLADTRHFVPQLKAIGTAVRMHVALTMGNLAEALHWAEESGLSLNDAAYPREREYLTLARVYIAQGRENPAGRFFEDALHLLDRLLQEARGKARVSSILEILILQALALHAQGQRERAFTTLERALTLAAHEGYVRLFVDEGTPMQTLLRQYHPDRHGSLYAYVAMLLATFDGQPATISSSPSPLPEPLTEREREVLRLLLEGAANREIAHRLVLSINTVKRHIYNICGKLGVQSRTQAIVKARALDLL